jgi:hypothetical protein
MKGLFVFISFLMSGIFSCRLYAQTAKAGEAVSIKNLPSAGEPAPAGLYLDVHHLGPGKVSYEAVAGAHTKDLAVQGKYGVHFIKYWVDTAAGNVFCLAYSPDEQSIRKTHGEAHGLLPDEVYQVSGGQSSAQSDGKKFFMDVHEFGPGNVSAKDVQAAHQKDLATEKKYGVNFINYWVDEKKGVVVCLSQAKDSADVVHTHQEAHGLLPAYIINVQPGK